jgi:chromosome segregation ATPase
VSALEEQLQNVRGQLAKQALDTAAEWNVKVSEAETRAAAAEQQVQSMQAQCDAKISEAEARALAAEQQVQLLQKQLEESKVRCGKYKGKFKKMRREVEGLKRVFDERLMMGEDEGEESE